MTLQNPVAPPEKPDKPLPPPPDKSARVAQCPACEGSDIVFDSQIEFDGDGPRYENGALVNTYQTICSDCGLRGPRRDTKNDAAVAFACLAWDPRRIVLPPPEPESAQSVRARVAQGAAIIGMVMLIWLGLGCAAAAGAGISGTFRLIRTTTARTLEIWPELPCTRELALAGEDSPEVLFTEPLRKQEAL